MQVPIGQTADYQVAYVAGQKVATANAFLGWKELNRIAFNSWARTIEIMQVMCDDYLRGFIDGYHHQVEALLTRYHRNRPLGKKSY